MYRYIKIDRITQETGVIYYVPDSVEGDRWFTVDSNNNRLWHVDYQDAVESTGFTKAIRVSELDD